MWRRQLASYTAEDLGDRASVARGFRSGGSAPIPRRATPLVRPFFPYVTRPLGVVDERRLPITSCHASLAPPLVYIKPCISGPRRSCTIRVIVVLIHECINPVILVMLSILVMLATNRVLFSAQQTLSRYKIPVLAATWPGPD